MTAISLYVTLDKKDLRELSRLKGKARMAGAKALTWTAKDAQKALQTQAGGVFHLRNSWVPRGIRIDPATPGTMNARVGSIDKYMERHVTGQGKRPARSLTIRGSRDSSGRLATGGLLVKPYGSIAQAPTHNVVRRRLKRVDTQKRKTFQIIGRGGSVLLVRRTTKKRSPLEVMAVLKNQATVTPRWPLQGTVQGVVSARFGAHFERAISKK